MIYIHYLFCTALLYPYQFLCSIFFLLTCSLATFALGWSALPRTKNVRELSNFLICYYFSYLLVIFLFSAVTKFFLLSGVGKEVILSSGKLLWLSCDFLVQYFIQFRHAQVLISLAPFAISKLSAIPIFFSFYKEISFYFLFVSTALLVLMFQILSPYLPYAAILSCLISRSAYNFCIVIFDKFFSKWCLISTSLGT